MGFWKYLSITMLVLLVVGIIACRASWNTGVELTRNCIVIMSVDKEELNAPVIGLYLVSSKLFPLVNTRYATHWSVVAETNKGYYNISTARYMSIYIYPAIREDSYHFISSRWDGSLYTLNQYAVKPTNEKFSVYDIARSAMNYYNHDDKSSYSMINHNCQHVAQYIISTFGVVDDDDRYMVNMKGMELFWKSIKDAIYGPKVLL